MLNQKNVTVYSSQTPSIQFDLRSLKSSLSCSSCSRVYYSHSQKPCGIEGRKVFQIEDLACIMHFKVPIMVIQSQSEVKTKKPTHFDLRSTFQLPECTSYHFRDTEILRFSFLKPADQRSRWLIHLDTVWVSKDAECAKIGSTYFDNLVLLFLQV